jgi:hypothetical protein
MQQAGITLLAGMSCSKLDEQPHDGVTIGEEALLE